MSPTALVHDMGLFGQGRDKSLQSSLREDFEINGKEVSCLFLIVQGPSG